MKANISAVKARKNRLKLKAGNCAVKEAGILDHIEKIVEISNEHGLDECLKKGKEHFNYVTEKLDISPLQAVLFSQFLERSNDYNIQISEIAEALKCSTVRIIKYMNECEDLERKKLIRCSRNSNGVSYRIPREVRESLRKNNYYMLEKNNNLTITKLFYYIDKLFDERDNDELTYDTLKLELLDLINQNMHLLFCQIIKSYNLRDDNFVLLLCFCHLFGNNRDDNIMKHDIKFLYDNSFEFYDVKAELENGDHVLIKNNFVDYVNSDGLGKTDVWKLSDKAKKELLPELNIQNNSKKDLIQFESIKPKKLYYNTEQTKDINKLISLLHADNFCDIQNRLDNKGLRKGFACLFSGGPGTGKTETAYQIAKKTKRNIMMVDISQTKSMWFGESEKKIKEVFNNYKAAVESSNVTPILLINEADAIIGKRGEFSSSSRAVDQTSNTIQNIILQEIENLSGILIATTNLTQNMDKAFERRFLYKINFEKPGIESRIGIWNSLLPELNENGAVELAKRFEMSGGQIENIARKIEVDSILNGNNLSIDALTKYCKDEMHSGFNTIKQIGF